VFTFLKTNILQRNQRCLTHIYNSIEKSTGSSTGKKCWRPKNYRNIAGSLKDCACATYVNTNMAAEEVYIGTWRVIMIAVIWWILRTSKVCFSLLAYTFIFYFTDCWVRVTGGHGWNNWHWRVNCQLHKLFVMTAWVVIKRCI
jgi:hypothetical protein